MNRTAWVSVLAVMSLWGCGGATPEQQVINDAAAALGGRERIEAAKTLVVTGEGTAYAVGSDKLIDTNYRIYTLTGYKHAIDIAGARALVEQTRTPTTPNFSGQVPARQVQGIDGEVAYNVAANGNRTRAANAVTVRARRANMYHHPLTIVRAALDPAATVANARTEGNETLVDVTTGGVTLTLGVDGTTKLPTRVVSRTAGENILGDVNIETGFAEYLDVAGLKLPARLTRKTDTFKDFEMRVTHAVDGDIGDLAAPASVVSAPAAEAREERSIVNAEEVAKGIWHLTGTTHHSVLVEFSDHLALIEAPNEDRALGTFAKAKELRPNKPLTTLINTHHHLDHSAGIRAAVSEGLTIITHKSNGPFYEVAVKRPHTILPDVLAQNPNPPPLKLVTVDEEMTLEDDVMTLVMYRIVNNTHADNNLMIHFPRERILVQADIFMPRDRRTQGHAPWVKNLADNIEMRKLNIDRHVPLHGQIVPHSEFLQVVKDGFDRTVVKEPPPYRYSPT